MNYSRDDYNDQPWRQARRRPSSSRSSRPGGYDSLDEGTIRRSPQGSQRRRSYPSSDGARRGNAHRPSSDRSQYSRNSSRYSSTNSQRRRQTDGMPTDGRSRAAQQSHARGNPQRQYQQRASSASRYSRDRYRSQGGQVKGRPVSQQNFEAARRVKPINPRIFMVLGIIAAVLLAVFVIRIIVSGATVGEYQTLQNSISQEKAQLLEIETSTEGMQLEMDGWQATIDKYNKARK